MMKLNRFAFLTLVLCCLVIGELAWFTDVVEACPTCKDGLAESDPARASMVRGYFYSILFMMSMPFLILGSLGAYFYLLIRRAQAEREAASQVPEIVR